MRSNFNARLALAAILFWSPSFSGCTPKTSKEAVVKGEGEGEAVGLESSDLETDEEPIETLSTEAIKTGENGEGRMFEMARCRVEMPGLPNIPDPLERTIIYVGYNDTLPIEGRVPDFIEGKVVTLLNVKKGSFTAKILSETINATDMEPKKNPITIKSEITKHSNKLTLQVKRQWGERIWFWVENASVKDDLPRTQLSFNGSFEKVRTPVRTVPEGKKLLRVTFEIFGNKTQGSVRYGFTPDKPSTDNSPISTEMDDQLAHCAMNVELAKKLGPPRSQNLGKEKVQGL